MKILSIESSCDETSAAIIEKNGSDVRILSNIIASQIPIHKKYGGVFPEMASRAHTEKIVEVAEKAIKEAEEMFLSEGRSNDASFCKLNFNEAKQKGVSRMVRETGSEKTSQGLLQNIDAIAVTSGPGLIGSLLVGVNFAKTLSFVTRKPIIGVNHLLGHIYSCFTDNNLKNPEFPLLALIVSGGHTSLVLMKSHTEYNTIGETLDDAAGEAFDKVSKLLDLGYPGGPAIAAAAEKYIQSELKTFKANRGGEAHGQSRAERLDPISSLGKSGSVSLNDLGERQLPRPMIDSPDYNFSFSGLKTAVLHLVDKLRLITTNHGDQRSPNYHQSLIAFDFQQSVIDVLISKTIKAAKEFKPKSILLCGGVSANKELRKQMASQISHFTSHISFFVPPLPLSTDNAAMIGIAAAYHLDKKTIYDKISADANQRL